MCLASFPWGGEDPKSIVETSMEGRLSAPTMHLLLWLDGVLLESWKAENSPGNQLGMCELTAISFGFFWAALGSVGLILSEKGKGPLPA